MAGAWMRSGGEYRYAASVDYSTSDRYYDEGSDLQTAPCAAGNYYLNQSLEYGASYYYTVFGDISGAVKSCGAENNAGISDLRVGIRGRLDPYRNGRTWEFAVIIPTGYSRTEPSRLGYGRIGMELGVHGRFKAGGAVRHSHYWSTGAEIRLWDGPPADQFQTYVRYSMPVGDAGLDFGVDGEFSLGNGRPAPTEYVNQTRLDEYDRITVRASLNYRVGRDWRLAYRLSRAVWGRHTDASTSIGVTLSRSWME